MSPFFVVISLIACVGVECRPEHSKIKVREACHTGGSDCPVGKYYDEDKSECTNQDSGSSHCLINNPCDTASRVCENVRGGTECHCKANHREQILSVGVAICVRNDA